MEQEETPQGATEEQPKEEISKEVPKVSEEIKATSEKDNEWKRMMQSRTDTAEAKAQKLEKEVTQLRQVQEQQRLAARQKEIADLEGDTDAQAQARRKHQLEDELSDLENRKTQEEGAVQRKYDQAIELASKHNLSLADARELMNAESPREMELLAQLKVAEKKTPVVEPSVETPTPDSGTSDAGSDSDEAFIERYNRGDANSKEDHARAKKILDKLKK